ncbi:MAG: metal-dependent hydrolase [Planctomycetota bacterium]
MDPVTHMTLGAAVALSLSNHANRRASAGAGVIAGLLPDADVFIRSSADPLLAIEYHRGFTHGWVFQPVTALVAIGLSLLLGRLFRHRGSARPMFLAILAAALSHPFCDLWTSYGTRVNWPFSEARPALDLVSVIDPLLTLPLLIAAVVGWKRRSRGWALAGLVWVSLYLGLGAVQRLRALAAVQQHLAETGQRADRLAVRPSFGNIVVWRAVWQQGDRLHCAMVRLTGEVQWTEGESADLVQIDRDASLAATAPEGSVLRRDLARFAHFSDDWLVRFADQPDVIGDARYSMDPRALKPLWGIRMRGTDEHVAFETFRSDSRKRLSELLDLILVGKR